MPRQTYIGVIRRVSNTTIPQKSNTTLQTDNICHCDTDGSQWIQRHAIICIPTENNTLFLRFQLQKRSPYHCVSL